MSNEQVRSNVWQQTGIYAISGALASLLAFVLIIVPVLGAIVALGAVVLGVLALRRNQSLWLSIIAIGGGVSTLTISVALAVSMLSGTLG